MIGEPFYFSLGKLVNFAERTGFPWKRPSRSDTSKIWKHMDLIINHDQRRVGCLLEGG